MCCWLLVVMKAAKENEFQIPLCGLKKSRRSGMFCTECKNNAMKLLEPGCNLLPEEHRKSLEDLWKVHKEKDGAEKRQKNKDNKTRRNADDGANKRYASFQAKMEFNVIVCSLCSLD